MSHTHSHHHGPVDYGRAFAIGVALNLGFVGLEVFYGLASHSLALVADAGHNLSDVLALLLAWGASVLARRRPTQTHTYGMRRSSILAALFNALLLLVAIGAIAWEAVRRLVTPGPVEAETVIWVAAVGIAINTATALMFMRGRERDINIQGAFLHMAADAGVSLGVVVAGFAIAATGWTWLDPAVSLAIVVVIFIGTWGLLKESVNLALDAAPRGINVVDVRRYLTGLPGVVEVHDLHVWAMSTTETALTAHVVIPNHAGGDGLLNQAARDLHDQFGIEHTTLQIESADTDDTCHLATADGV